MEQEEYRKIKKDLTEDFDARYKKADECAVEMRAAKEEHTALFVVIGKMEERQKLNNWLTAAVAGGIIALVIKLFFGG